MIKYVVRFGVMRSLLIYTPCELHFKAGLSVWYQRTTIKTAEVLEDELYATWNFFGDRQVVDQLESGVEFQARTGMPF